MEDILASIRRIIADDQVQSQRPTGGGRRLGTPGTASDPGPSLRARDMRGAQDDILDLARIRSGESEERAAAERTAARPAADTRPPTKLVDSAFPGATRSPDFTPREPSAWSADPQRKVAAQPLHIEPVPSESDPEGLDVASLHDAEAYEPETDTAARSDLQQVAYGSGLAVEGAASDDALISAKPGAAVLSAFETLAATVVLQNDEMLERIMRDELRPLIKTWLDDNLPTMVERLVRSEIERVARGARS